MSELHYRYWLGICVAIIICILTINWAGIKDLAQLLSFGLALSSLVLAVIAIFQSIFSHTGLSRLSTSISDSVSEMKEAASEIHAATIEVSKQAGEIPSALGEISSKFANLQTHLQLSVDTTKVKEGAVTTDKNPFSYLSRHITYGGTVALYMCLTAYLKKKAFNPKNVIKNRTLAIYVQGFIAGLRGAGVMDIEIDSETNDFIVKDIKGIDVESQAARIKKFVTEKKSERQQEAFSEIEEFLES